MYANLWDLASAHVTDILSILDAMGSRGIRVDLGRLKEFNSRLDAEMALLQAKFDEIPELSALGGFHPKEGYKKVPKDTTGMELRTFEVWKEAQDEAGHPDPYQVKVERWAKKKPFKASSSKQVLAYQHSKGHKVEKSKEGKNTSDEKALLLAWRKYKDDNYKLIVDYRKLKKLRGTYGEWPLVQRRRECEPELMGHYQGVPVYADLPIDSFAVTKFTLKPTTGRLSSVAPNVQNIPKDGPLAEVFKRCLVARPGHKILSADLVSAEAMVTGFLAGSELYMRLATIGIHKYATAKYLKIPIDLSLSNEALKPILDAIKAEHPALVKKQKAIIYGGNYLAGAPTVYRNNPEAFSGQSEAKEFLLFCQSIDPKITEWQKATIRQATSQKKLTNPFGYSCDFWDLPKGDGPACVAFMPQSCIAYVMKEIMLQLWPTEAGRYMIWQVHDDLKFDIPDEAVGRVRSLVQTAFTQEWPQLGGLRFGVEIKVGEDMR